MIGQLPFVELFRGIFRTLRPLVDGMLPGNSRAALGRGAASLYAVAYAVRLATGGRGDSDPPEARQLTKSWKTGW